MSTFETIAKCVGSRRYARDLLGGGALTRPWWDCTFPLEVAPPHPQATSKLNSPTPIQARGKLGGLGANSEERK